MRKLLLATTLLLCISTTLLSQANDGLIALGKAYRQFMMNNEPPESFIRSLEKYDGTELAFASRFIGKTISQGAALLTDEYLKRPSNADLKHIYIVLQVNYNVRKDEARDNNELVNELLKKDFKEQELVDEYYSMLFTALSNKVRPFDLSNVNFELDNYGLKNDTEKGIFFLQAMRMCGAMIWGYMNIPKPPNYAEAMSYISKYPKFNSLPYYQYLDFSFPDFKTQIDSDKKPESYKSYYINKYYETLIYHLVSIAETSGDKEEMNKLMLGSILKEQNYYKYANKNNEKLLRKIFEKVRG
jgi:hypothetical protein